MGVMVRSQNPAFLFFINAVVSSIETCKISPKQDFKLLQFFIATQVSKVMEVELWDCIGQKQKIPYSHVHRKIFWSLLRCIATRSFMVFTCIAMRPIAKFLCT